MNKSQFLQIAEQFTIEKEQATLYFNEDSLLLFAKELFKKNSNEFIPLGDSNFCLLKDNNIFIGRYNQDNFKSHDEYIEYVKSLGYNFTGQNPIYTKESHLPFNIILIP